MSYGQTRHRGERNGSRDRLRAVGRRALMAFRCALVVMSLSQLTGMTHALADQLADDPDRQHCTESCPDEDESADFECPPFCPTCSCAHAGRPFLVGASTLIVLSLVELPQALGPAAPVCHYKNPPPSSVFRPPRS